jgi:hypothetical protein
MMGLPILSDIITTVGNLAGKFIKDKDQIEAFKHEIDMSLTQMDFSPNGG